MQDFAEAFSFNKLQTFNVQWHRIETFMVKKALLGRVGDSEIRLLRIFKAVVECGGLSAAERELNVGRSTVSRHVKDLEERLGLVLCRRGRAGFALTADGQRVYDGAQQLLEAMDAFRTDVRDLHADLVGNLVLGIFDKTATNPKAPHRPRDTRLPACRTRHRDRHQCRYAHRHRICRHRRSASGRLQVGIVPDRRRSDSLDYYELFTERMYSTAAANIRCLMAAMAR